MFQENEETGRYEELFGGFEDDDGCYGPIFNSWGNKEKIIPQADALNGLHSRYDVQIKALTYKGYSTGDISMIWGDGYCDIYLQDSRKFAKKKYGLDRDYTP